MAESLKFNILTNIVFLIAFITHVSFIFYHITFPSTPSVRQEMKKLKDITFPVVFNFCFNECDNDRYQKYGYLYDQRLFKGDSAYNKNLYGWNGHTKNGSTLMPIKGIKIFV